MIKDFLIINFIGKENKIGLKVSNNFYIHDFDQKTDNDQLSLSILNMIKKYKVNLSDNFSVLVNNGCNVPHNNNPKILSTDPSLTIS